jgi:hypothetical protein
MGKLVNPFASHAKDPRFEPEWRHVYCGNTIWQMHSQISQLFPDGIVYYCMATMVRDRTEQVSRLVYTVGLVVEYSPATGETRVRFPDGVPSEVTFYIRLDFVNAKLVD